MHNIETTRLLLEPLTVAHAERMFLILSEPSLHSFLDSSLPESVDSLRERYAKLEARVSPDGSQRWLNWIVVLPREGPIGFVQATVVGKTAWVAYLLGRAHWSHGYAAEGTSALLNHLASVYEISLFRATVELANSRSIALLESLGFRSAMYSELASLSLSVTERSYVKIAGAGSYSPAHVETLDTNGNSRESALQAPSVHARGTGADWPGPCAAARMPC